ncbi:MAG: MATE family efflux transporter [Eubacteriales bacterium]
MKDNTFLGTEKTGKLLFKLAVPAVTAQLVNLLYNLVDRIYIGHIAEIGTEALTGVGVCLPIIMLISAFAYLVGSGGAPRASIFMGSGDNDTAEKILGNCFTLLLGVSVVLTVVFYVWNEPLLMAFGASEKTVGYGVEYMAIYALGTIFVLMALGLNVFITAQGFTVVSMLSVVIGAVLNIALDPLFIFAFGMNVEGAALATIISQAVSCAFVVAFLSGRHSLLRLRWKNFLPRVKIFLPCLLLGLSPFIMQATESVITVCFNSSLQAAKGDIAVGAMTILSSIMMFCMMPLQGITQGAQPIVSYNFGAKNTERVKQTFKYTFIACCAYTVLLWAVVQIFPKTVAMAFSSDAELIAYTARALRIYMAVSCVFGAQIACQQTFVAIGKAGISFFLAVLRKILLLLPLIYIMPAVFAGDPATAIYAAEPVADFLAVATTVTCFTVLFGRAMKKLDKERAEEQAAAVTEADGND